MLQSSPTGNDILFGVGEVYGPLPDLFNASLFSALVQSAFLSLVRHFSKFALAFDPIISSPPQM